MNISLRVDEALLERLKNSAHKSGHDNLSREIANRLNASFRYKKPQDPAIRALCYLISETAKHVAPSRPDGSGDPSIHWRSSPFFYAAFKVAIDRILDALKPPGEIHPPTFKFDQELDDFLTDFVEAHKSPDRLGVRTADFILQMFNRLPALTTEEREQERKEEERWLAEIGFPPGLLGDEYYAMPEAARDLAKPFENTQSDVTMYLAKMGIAMGRK